MGIPIIGPCLTYGDNNAVVTKSTLPDSVLKKKSNSIAYSFVREGITRDEWRCRYILTDENISDLCTKPLAYSDNVIVGSNFVKDCYIISMIVISTWQGEPPDWLVESHCLTVIEIAYLISFAEFILNIHSIFYITYSWLCHSWDANLQCYVMLEGSALSTTVEILLNWCLTRICSQNSCY